MNQASLGIGAVVEKRKRMRLGIDRGTRGRPLAALALGCALVLVLAGCSTSSGSKGGINFSVGLAGSTADHPAQPPTIAANGPAGTYAFIYDNQIWLRQDGQKSATQLTHLVLSNGGTLAWGPLVWSPSGKYLAFALIQDLTPAVGAPPRSSGGIYYVDVSDPKHGTFATPATGSIYGHTYTWFGDGDLIYSDGGGIQLYNLGSPDPRVFPLYLVNAQPVDANGPTDYYAFGDVTFSEGYLYYTRLDIRSPGRPGAVGSAQLKRANLGSPDNYGAGEVPTPTQYTSEVLSLGIAYADAAGDYVAGAWQVRAGTLVAQQITDIDANAKQLTTRICSTSTSNYGYGATCPGRILSNVGGQPITIHPQIALASSGRHSAAYMGDALYLQGVDGKFTPAGWPSPPAWSPDGLVALTQLASQSTDSAGLTHSTTDIAIFHPGQQGSVLIAGGQNIAWQP